MQRTTRGRVRKRGDGEESERMGRERRDEERADRDIAAAISPAEFGRPNGRLPKLTAQFVSEKT